MSKYRQAKTPQEYLNQRFQIKEEERKQIMMLRGKESGIKVASKYNVSFSRIYQMWRSNAA